MASLSERVKLSYRAAARTLVSVVGPRSIPEDSMRDAAIAQLAIPTRHAHIAKAFRARIKLLHFYRGCWATLLAVLVALAAINIFRLAEDVFGGIKAYLRPVNASSGTIGYRPAEIPFELVVGCLQVIVLSSLVLGIAWLIWRRMRVLHERADDQAIKAALFDSYEHYIQGDNPNPAIARDLLRTALNTFTPSADSWFLPPDEADELINNEIQLDTRKVHD